MLTLLWTWHAQGPLRKQACLSELAKIRVLQGSYLPSSPEAVIVDIDYSSGAPMQSAAKAPFRARFKVRTVGIHKVQEIATSGFEEFRDSEFFAQQALEQEHWLAAIFKVGGQFSRHTPRGNGPFLQSSLVVPSRRSSSKGNQLELRRIPQRQVQDRLMGL